MSGVAHPSVAFGKTGILLVNLGTPDSPDTKGLRPYLKQFLSDRRVIETSPLVWQPILRGIILNTRPRKSARAYAKIWNDETNESPLRYFTRLQAEKLKYRLGDTLEVEWAMRYGLPSIADKLAELKTRGCERISVIALYPQYSASTSASVYDEVFRALLDMRWQPALRTVPPYHDDPVYIDALAKSVENHLATLDWEPELIITSFHGIPQSYFKKGDPYHCQCQKTARLLRERLGLSKDRLMITFQSRFGPEEWLQPYTDKTVKALPKKGIKRIAVMNPGFVSDCLETLEEIGEQARESFMEHGGEKFTHIPCLNDSDEGMRVIDHVVARELSGWVN